MSYVTEELSRRGWCVEQRTTVTDALSYLASFAHLIEGVILDWMLPQGGESSDDDIELFGGRVVLAFLASKHPGIPVIVFTNVTRLHVADSDSSSVVVVNKIDYPPDEFCDLVARHFGNGLTQ